MLGRASGAIESVSCSVICLGYRTDTPKLDCNLLAPQPRFVPCWAKTVLTKDQCDDVVLDLKIQARVRTITSTLRTHPHRTIQSQDERTSMRVPPEADMPSS